MRLLALIASFFVGLTSLVAAQTFDTPKALLEAFYQPYFTDDFYEDETPYRSAALNALYANDASGTPDGEMGALSFDPYIDGQDFELADLKIGDPAISGDRAEVNVSFTNFGDPVSLTYDLVKENGGWRIDDVASTTPGAEYRLSEIFSEAQPE